MSSSACTRLMVLGRLILSTARSTAARPPSIITTMIGPTTGWTGSLNHMIIKGVSCRQVERVLSELSYLEVFNAGPSAEVKRPRCVKKAAWRNDRGICSVIRPITMCLARSPWTSHLHLLHQGPFRPHAFQPHSTLQTSPSTP